MWRRNWRQNMALGESGFSADPFTLRPAVAGYLRVW